VALSHRLREKGYRLVVNPALLVRHIFNFSLGRSFANAFRKSLYWTAYSLQNKDILSDSGTASRELKADVSLFYLCLASSAAGLSAGPVFFFLCFPALAAGLFISRGLLRAFWEAGGAFFALSAYLYYALLYPIPVGAGALAGVVKFFSRCIRGKETERP